MIWTKSIYYLFKFVFQSKRNIMGQNTVGNPNYYRLTQDWQSTKQSLVESTILDTVIPF